VNILTNDGNLPAEDILALLSRAGDEIMRFSGVDEFIAEVSLSFVGEDEMRELNRRYRGVDRVTDVLSFPQYESLEEFEIAARLLTDKRESGARISIGDVVICSARASEQASAYGHSPRREFVYLFAHGMFHLLGYDHEEDAEKRRMREAEEIVIAKISEDLKR
jgi:probable rRNA maturation factor